MNQQVDLHGVSETALWTLYARARAAGPQYRLLDDPMAIELVQALDYPFVTHFGRGRLAPRWQAQRVRTFDDTVRAFLGEHPDGTVVALGEGLETQFWRVDNGRVDWLSVDLPESIELRRGLLPARPRLRHLACSALDSRWLDEVDTARGVLITAHGLLMYFTPPEVRQLLATCAQRFPGGSMVFDTVPRSLAARTRRSELTSPTGFPIPTWQWAVNADELPKLVTAHPNIRDVRELRPSTVPGLIGHLVPPLWKLPNVRNLRPAFVHVRFDR